MRPLQDVYHSIFIFSRMAKMNFMSSTTHSETSSCNAVETPVHMRKETLWTPSLRCDSDTQSSSEDEQVNPVEVFNVTMKTLSTCSHKNKMTKPLTFQLNSSWDSIPKQEQEVCIEKATEACNLICKIITPNASNGLVQAIKLTEPKLMLFCMIILNCSLERIFAIAYCAK